MGVMGRANQKLGGGGDWLDKDELIRLRLPMAIVDIKFDRVGTGKFPGENWIITLEPWDADKFPGPSGNLRFKNIPTRQGQFEDISEQLEEAKASSVPYIGPVALISGTSNAGFRFKTLADVMVTEAGEVAVDKRGFPRIEGEAEVEVGTPVAAPAGPRRPSGGVKQQSTGQQERVAATQEAEKPATAPEASAAPTAQPPEPAPPPAPKRRGRPAAQPAPLPPGTPPEVARHEAASQAEAAAEVIKPPANQPEVTQTIPMATALCPHCNVEIGPSRVYPSAAGGFVIMHPHCPVKQDTVILTVNMDEQGEA
jgi:hypothetical protein